MALPGSDLHLLENDKLLTHLKHCTNLSSPPGVAAWIIELGQDPHAGMGDVASDRTSLLSRLTRRLFCFRGCGANWYGIPCNGFHTDHDCEPEQR